jgi:hypothetical protein
MGAIAQGSCAQDTYVAKRPPQVRLAQGHLSIAKPTVSWDFPANMAGVGGVRATLPDMLRYVEGELGTRESAITPVLARTHQCRPPYHGYELELVHRERPHHRRA